MITLPFFSAFVSGGFLGLGWVGFVLGSGFLGVWVFFFSFFGILLKEQDEIDAYELNENGIAITIE